MSAYSPNNLTITLFFQHPQLSWYPSNDLVHPSSNGWPWVAGGIGDDTFRVLAAMDMDGDDKVYDTKWAAALFNWRDWVNSPCVILLFLG